MKNDLFLRFSILLTMLSQNEISLKVLDGYPDTPQYTVHMDNDSMNLLGISPQNFIEIKGKRKILATCLSLYLLDKEKKGIIRVSKNVRDYADISIGDTVTVRRIKIVKAETVLVRLPSNSPTFDMDRLSCPQNRPLVKGGDVLFYSNSATKGFISQVIDFTPEADAGEVTEKTIFLSTREEDNIGTSKKIVDDGLKYFHEGEYEKSLECFDKVTQYDQKNIDAWNWKGYVYLKNNQLNDALGCYDKVLDMDSKNIEALRGKGTVLLYIDKLEDSISYYNKALEIDPSHTEVLMGKGFALKKNNMFDEAISCFDKVIQNKDEAIRGWIYKGLALVQKGDLDNAMFCFQESLNIETDNAHSLFGIALVKANEDKFDESLSMLKEAITLDPSIKQEANYEKLFGKLRLDKRFAMLVAEEMHWMDEGNPNTLGLLPSFYREHYAAKEKSSSFSKMKNKVFGNDEHTTIFLVLEAYTRDVGTKIVRISPKDRPIPKDGEIMEIIRSPVFAWNEVPGNDIPWLLSFLKIHFKIEWIEDSTITKINNGHSILLTAGEKNITIDLDTELSKATMLMFDEIYYKYTFSVPESSPLYVYPDKYKTIVKCLPLYPSDEGKGIFRFNQLVRLSTSTSIGEWISISKTVEVKEAKKVIVRPLQKIPPIDERCVTESLKDMPLVKGDYVTVGYFGGSLYFKVIGIVPSNEAVIVTDNTVSHIAEQQV